MRTLIVVALFAQLKPVISQRTFAEQVNVVRVAPRFARPAGRSDASDTTPGL